MNDYSERDWKLFQQKLPQWQESHMEEQFRIRIAALTTTAAGLMKYVRKDAEKMNETENSVDQKSFLAELCQ